MRARPKMMKKLGKVERRWWYASWTSPLHYNLPIGLMPHVSPKHVYASEYYKKEFLQFNERLGRHDIQFKSLVPRLYLPLLLQENLGYRYARHGPAAQVLRWPAFVLSVEHRRNALPLWLAG